MHTPTYSHYLFVAVLAVVLAVPELNAQTMCPPLPDLSDWPIHDMSRPKPEIVDPGIHQGLQRTPQPAPSDAMVLFDGTDLDAWESTNDGPAEWKVENGYMEVVSGSGGIRTRQAFGSQQLHIEFMTPAPPSGEGQGRGNSGVFLMDTYEVQVLDSYENETYADGQASALYGEHPPLVNASRPPGTWQVYDIIFMRPEFDDDGTLTKPGTVTVLHNGVLTQNAAVLTGPTTHTVRTPYQAHEDALPLSLQDHGNPMRFRNIWVRPLD